MQHTARKSTMLSFILGMALVTGAQAQAATSAEIASSLANNPLALSKSRLARLADFYNKRNKVPAWGANQTSQFSKANFISILDANGLDPAKYTGKIDANCPADIASAGEASLNCELALSEAVLRSADHLQNGQLNPTTVDFENIKMDPKKNNAAIALSSILDASPQDIMYFLEQQAPQNFLYQRHKNALQKFNAIKAQGGGWKPVSLSKVRLSVGSKHSSIPTIKKIMAAHGYQISDSSEVYTSELEAAVKDLEKATLLPVTGRIESSNQTLFSQFFGIEIDRRIARLKLDMEKLRWMPSQLEGSFIFVGLGEQQLTWFDTASSGGIKMQMKTVNGQTGRKTPMMRDVINAIILNPPWTVPPGVLAKDKLPLFKSQSRFEMQNYFATNFYTLIDMDSSKMIDPLAVNWANITAANINFYIRQRPGLHNALGRFKFNLTNPYAIYLHDTNAKQLFAEPIRLLSSGCVRLEKPQELAEEILRGTAWDRSKIEGTIAQYPGQVPESSTTIGLKNKLPVYLMYMTSSVKEDGIIRFHPDYYGMNAVMLEKLEAAKNDI